MSAQRYRGDVECPECGHIGEFELAMLGELECPACGHTFDPARPDGGGALGTRRSFLRRAGAGAITAVSIGTFATGATATTMIDPDEAGVDEAIAAHEYHERAELREEVSTDAFCSTAYVTCPAVTAVAAFDPIPADEILVGGVCGLAISGCVLRDELEKYHGNQDSYRIYETTENRGSIEPGGTWIVPGEW